MVEHSFGPNFFYILTFSVLARIGLTRLGPRTVVGWQTDCLLWLADRRTANCDWLTDWLLTVIGWQTDCWLGWDIASNQLSDRKKLCYRNYSFLNIVAKGMRGPLQIQQHKKVVMICKSLVSAEVAMLVWDKLTWWLSWGISKSVCRWRFTKPLYVFRFSSK